MVQVDLTTFHIDRVDRSHSATLVALLELYCRDMEQWLSVDRDQAGGFTYPLEAAWNEGTHVYLAYVNELPVGFALVGSAQCYVGDPNAKDMVEFFVTRHVRRNGIGRTMAAHLWHQYPSNWLMRVYQGNSPAMRFWVPAISIHTSGHYREEVRSISGKPWSYFTFSPSNYRLERP